MGLNDQSPLNECILYFTILFVHPFLLQTLDPGDFLKAQNTPMTSKLLSNMSSPKVQLILTDIFLQGTGGRLMVTLMYTSCREKTC